MLPPPPFPRADVPPPPMSEHPNYAEAERLAAAQRAAGHYVIASGVVEHGSQAYAGLLPPFTTDFSATRPYPALGRAREAQPHGPLRPP
eukprot:1518693-Alexandrium_andersonii.AAC.1